MYNLAPWECWYLCLVPLGASGCMTGMLSAIQNQMLCYHKPPDGLPVAAGTDSTTSCGPNWMIPAVQPWSQMNHHLSQKVSCRRPLRVKSDKMLVVSVFIFSKDRGCFRMICVVCGNVPSVENKCNHPHSNLLPRGSRHPIIYQRGVAHVPTDLHFLTGLTYKDKQPCPLTTRGNLDYTVVCLLAAIGDKHWHRTRVQTGWPREANVLML